MIEERRYRLDELKRNPIVNFPVLRGGIKIPDWLIDKLSKESSGELLFMVSDNIEELKNEIERRYGTHACWGLHLYIIDLKNYSPGEYELELIPSGQSKDDEKDDIELEM